MAKAKAKRSAAQKAATAKMVAANRRRAKGAGGGSKRSKRSKSKRSKSKGLARTGHTAHASMGLLPFTAKNTQANLKRLALGLSSVAHHSAETREAVKSMEGALVSKGVLSSRFSYSR